MAWQSQRQEYITGKGGIKCRNCEAISTSQIVVTFDIWFSPKYKLTDKSLKLFYTKTPGSNNQFVYVTKTNALEYTNVIGGAWYRIKYALGSGGGGEDPLEANTQYYIRPWFQLQNKKGTVKARLASPADFPFPETTWTTQRRQPLLEIAKPSTTNPSSGSEIPEPMEFVDLTEYITAPSYDVNNIDVTEDWTDSNWTTHRIVPRTKISGKFNMLFRDVESYNKFYNLMKLNRDIYGLGYTYLRVQINNELDYQTPGSNPNDITSYKCNRSAGLFFVKIDSNPWVEPYYGRFDKYNAISVSIEEA